MFPLGIALVETVGKSSDAYKHASIPMVILVILGTWLIMSALTAIPARIGTGHSTAQILQAERDDKSRRQAQNRSNTGTDGTYSARSIPRTGLLPPVALLDEMTNGDENPSPGQGHIAPALVESRASLIDQGQKVRVLVLPFNVGSSGFVVAGMARMTSGRVATNL